MSAVAARVLLLAGILGGAACTGTLEAGAGDGDAGGEAHGVDAGGDVGGDEPDFAALPWSEIGVGVAYKDSGNPRGDRVFIGYAGYGVDDAGARAWVNALYGASLRELGVRHVFAVRGPDTVTYANREIQNSLLVATLLPALAGDASIAVAAHSSGAWVACELFEQLFGGGLDPGGATAGRIVYYDLDGLYGCLPEGAEGSLRALHFVYAESAAGTSLNAGDMAEGAAAYGQPPLVHDASASGCAGGASLCLHVSLVNTVPHDPSTGSPFDYADFEGRPVNTFYLDATAGEL
ncbi:MAG TPA: hypothetical protein VMZ28_05655 [Kofleriaceae bacterium]|nr:hypothetical protein [Kofleriaceae bacterium]